MRRTGNGNSNSGNSGNNGSHSRKKQNPLDFDFEVPFRDADPDTGELPLDEIDTFVIPARDEKGTSTSIQLRVPPYLDRHMEVVVRSGRFPYLKSADFIRHAIYRHLIFCVSIRQSIPRHIVPELEAMLEACRDDEIKQMVEHAFDKIEARVRHHSARGDMAEVFRLLTFVKARIEIVEPSSWQRRFIIQFVERYANKYMSLVAPPKMAEKGHHSHDGHN